MAYETIQETFTNPEEVKSGTNMDAGIERARAEIATLPEAYGDAETYLITLSDGITYIWDEDGTTMTVPVIQQRTPSDSNPGEITIDKSSTTWDMIHGAGVSFTEIYGSFEDFLTQIPEKMTASRSKGYVKSYDGNYTVNTPGILTTYIYDPVAKQEIADTYACSPEFSAYESAVGYSELVKSFDKSFAYPVPECDASGKDTSTWEEFYPWGKELMLYCQSLSTNQDDGVISNDDAATIFDEIADEILYTIKSGTVTDIIGSNFDLTAIGSFELAAGGEKQNTTVSGNTVYFGEKTGNDYPYSVTYYPNGVEGDAREQFVWNINVPVENAKPLELTYTLKLVNRSTVEGSYTVPTNEDATLTYESTDVGNGTEKFPQPEVTYTVTGPSSGSGSGSGSGSSSGSSSSPAQTTSAQTGDETNILLPVVTLVVAAAALAAVGTVYYRKKRS